MMKKLFFILLTIPMVLQAQKSISGTFTPAEKYTWFIIYQLQSTHQEYIDNGKVVEGKMTYTFKEDAPTGMYRLVYGMPQESMNFDFIYNGKEDIVFTFDDNGSEFTESKENKLNTSYFSSVNLVKRNINDFYQAGKTDEKEYVSIFNTLRDTQEVFEKEAEGTIVEHFIKANRFYMPTSYEKPATMVTNIKKHYFDHINFSNPYLQNSNFLADKISNYVFTALPLKEFTPEELMEEHQKNIAMVAEKIKDVDAPFKKTLFSVLWEQMTVLENQEVANHISEKYLLPLAKQLNDKNLATRLETYKRLSFGEVAPEITWKDEEDKVQRLSKLEGAENYIIVFWSSTCSHCLEELPKLKKFVKSQGEGKFKVVALGLEDERASWANESVFYPDFIHVLALNKWDSTFADLYDVSETPTFFVLNKDKRIIGKPYAVKDLEEYYSKDKKD